MNRQLTNELRFAYKVRQALNESASQLPPERVEALAAARKAALRVQKPQQHVLAWARSPVHAALGAAPAGEPGFFGRIGIALALFFFVGISVVGLYEIEQDNRINTLAEIDSGVLVDELPISAYTDHGFNAFLKRAE